MLPDPEIPDRWYEPDRVEVDISRQLMFVIRNGEITGILPVSTGGGYTYLSVRSGQAVAAHTPRGDFQLMWRQYGWNCDRTTGWCVYNYWAFTPFYGIHGYHDVPAYPASHGCTRVNTWDSDWLDSQLYVGMPVHVWDEPPSVAPRPPPPAHPTA
jgi:N-acetylmuramoyl-L-alanine amidase